MNRADSVLSTPRTDSPLFQGEYYDKYGRRLAVQEARRQRAIARLEILRRRASREIERLLAFLDASDPYVQSELEEDDEREEDAGEMPEADCDKYEGDGDCDDEPSLGWTIEGAVTATAWKAVDLEVDPCARSEPWLTCSGSRLPLGCFEQLPAS